MLLLNAALSAERFEKTKAAVSNIRKRRYIQATLRLQSGLQDRKRELGASEVIPLVERFSVEAVSIPSETGFSSYGNEAKAR